MDSSSFVLRPGGTDVGDAAALMGALDAAIDHLKATGNVDQWGPTRFSDRNGYLEAVEESLLEREKYRTTGKGQAKRAVMAEIACTESNGDNVSFRRDAQGRCWLQVASLEIWENTIGENLTKVDGLRQYIDEAKAQPGGFLFVNSLLADHRAGDRAKGAGKALMEYAEEHAIKQGMSAVYLDCWIGGTAGLVR
ncbi:hypothetical protein VHEMI02420 [[Torrubiella] hemipterigena]|uniref:N-acetyltransferase domain-containing protein n=1 Tax=[Torrubiella] hemipterigena TaxID=1531966 RepID=A0A0A1T852_9HYPO|nr:hypothetical protein VHEMI02420 [[Torrubiella] hemipterigena]